MKAVLSVIALAMLLAGCGKPETESPPALRPTFDERVIPGDPELNTALQTFADKVRERTEVPAIGVAVVTADEGLVGIAVSGVRVAGGQEAASVFDLWHIGSCTKAITAAMYARRVEAGDVRWGQSPLWLAPELRDAADAGWAGVPAEDFMSHASGIGQLPDGFLMQARFSSEAPERQRVEWVSQRLASAPTAEAAGRFEYSNFNFMLIGAALESGRAPWESQASDFLVQIGLTPDEFGFGPPQGAQPQGHVGMPPYPVGQGPNADNPTAMGPAGTIHLSLPGWAKFVRLFLTDGGEVLSPESVEKLTTPWPEGATGRGMGWFVEMETPAGKMIYHAGSNTMWFAQAVILPEQGYAVLVVTNQGGGMGETAVVSLTQLAMGEMKARSEAE